MAPALALVAALISGSFEREFPATTTPIELLDASTRVRHTEVLRVERDFGKPNVDVALDAWTSAHDPKRIDAVRLWWSDDVDRYPFSAKVRKHLRVEYRRVRADRWRITVGRGKRQIRLDVALHRGKPAVFGDVIAGGRIVRNCRADAAQLHARRVLGIPVGVDAMHVTCKTQDGRTHRGTLRVRGRSSPGRR